MERQAHARGERRILGSGGAHTPGIWVFYFSMAALPLFGIGQRFIPVADVGRRRYVFALLLVYVAAALSLLVTTSFLNLRRYLRQRRVEMPVSIAGTWVGLGVGIILLVIGLLIKIPILWTLGVIALVVGVILLILGAAGRAVGGRKHWY